MGLVSAVCSLTPSPELRQGRTERKVLILYFLDLNPLTESWVNPISVKFGFNASKSVGCKASSHKALLGKAQHPQFPQSCERSGDKTIRDTVWASGS